MRRIYKYKLDTVDSQEIIVHRLSLEEDDFKDQVLNLETQHGEPYLWCLVDPTQSARLIKIRIVGTGNPMPLLTKNDYLGSYMLNNQQLVFHVFIERDDS